MWALAGVHTSHTHSVHKPWRPASGTVAGSQLLSQQGSQCGRRRSASILSLYVRCHVREAQRGSRGQSATHLERLVRSTSDSLACRSPLAPIHDVCIDQHVRSGPLHDLDKHLNSRPRDRRKQPQDLLLCTC